MVNVRLGAVLRCGLALLGGLTAGCSGESDAPDTAGHVNAVAPVVVVGDAGAGSGVGSDAGAGSGSGSDAGVGSDAGAGSGSGSDAGVGGCPVACTIDVWINPRLDPALDVALSNRPNVFQNAVTAWNNALNTMCNGRALPRLNYAGQSINYAVAYPVPPNVSGPENISVNGNMVATGKTVFSAMGTMRPNQVASTAPGQMANNGGAAAPAGDGYIGKSNMGVGSGITVDNVLADQTGRRPNSANIVWYTHYLGNPSTRIGWNYGAGTVSGAVPVFGAVPVIPFLNVMEHELGHVLGAPDQNQGIMNGTFNPNAVNNAQITQNDVNAVPAGCN